MPVVVVTGGSAGIGADLVRALVALPDFKVVSLARRKEALDEVAKSTSDPSRVFTQVADLRDRKQVAEAVRAAIAAFGGIDVWVNNAGVGLATPVSKLTDEDITSMIQANVSTALYGMQEVLPHFKEKGTGQIINISSLLGRNAAMAHGTYAAYSAAKHFLNALTDSLRAELKPEFPGIVVTTVSPGVVATDFGPMNRAYPDAQDPKDVAAVIVKTIQERGTDYYTKPEHKGFIDGYFASLGRGAQ